MSDAADAGMLIGYARCSTDKQDLRVQKEQLRKFGVADTRIYTDEGATGTKRTRRVGLDKALEAVRDGDTFVVTKLDRLARSVIDAHNIISELADQGVTFSLGGQVHNWHDPFGRMFLQQLSTFAEFEANLIRMRTREGMAAARAKGNLKGRKPKLGERQDTEIRRMYDSGEYYVTDIAELFSVDRGSVYRSLRRTNPDGRTEQA